MTSAELETLVRTLIADPDASFCAAAVLTARTEEVCRDFSKRTKCTKKYGSITLYKVMEWTASAAVVVGDRCRPTSPNGCYYSCTVAGDTDSGSDPTAAWTTTNAATVTDGTVTWTCYTGDASLFSLPTDCNQIIRIWDENDIDLTEESSLNFTASDLSTISQPISYVRDMGGPDKIRLYPQPNASGKLGISYVHEHIVTGDSTFSLEIPERYHGGIAYGAAAKILLLSSNEMDAAKMAAYQSFYESTVSDAIGDLTRVYSSRGRSVPYRHF